jgi:hypothetical protein
MRRETACPSTLVARPYLPLGSRHVATNRPPEVPAISVAPAASGRLYPVGLPKFSYGRIGPANSHLAALESRLDVPCPALTCPLHV